MARTIQRGRSAVGAAAAGGRKKKPLPKLGDPPPSSSSDDDDELEFKGSQENDDEEESNGEEEEEEDERKPPAKKSGGSRKGRAEKAPAAPRRRKKAPATNAKHKKDQEDEEEAEYQDEAEDGFDSADDGADSPVPSDPNDSGSDFNPDEDDGEEDDEDDELNESSDGWAPEGTGRRSKVRSRGKAGGAKKKPAPTRSSRRANSRASRRRKIVESSSEEENTFDNDSSDDDEFGSPSRHRTPRRSCAKATNAKLASATKAIELGSDQDEADAESEDYPMISSSRKKKRKRSGGKGRSQRKKAVDSDEESYHESDSDEADVEEDDDDDDKMPSSDDDVVIEEDDEDVIRSGRSRRGGGRSKSKEVKGRKSVDDDMDIFTADTSDSDASDGGNQRRKFSPKPPLKTKPVRRRAIDDDDSDEEEASFGGDSDDSNFGSAIKRKSSQSTPRTPKCPSKTDEITMEPLPRLHVCCIAPDGESRHCFALDTLYRIALMDPRRHHSDSNKIAFKQPPHFRSIMEDELVDQIASRFGRLALNIEDSNVYKKSVVGQNRIVHLDYLGNMSVDASQDFHDRFNEYLSSQMGSGDLYCCPVCYVEAHKRLIGSIEPDDDSDAGTDGARASSRQMTMELDDFQYDPMTVLGGLDGEDFGIASNFCFRKVSQVKKHLRDDHHCATKDVEGNDLYQRFQIRAADGLLQRWLNKHDKKVFHLKIRSAGAMNSYWHHGNNASFIFLRDRVDAVQRIREAPGDEDSELDQADMQKSAEYFESFERRGRRIWAQLSAPYEKEDPSAINDFIADDDEEEEVDDGPAPFAANIFDDEKSPEQQIIEAMKKKRRRQGPASDVSSDDYDEEESSEDDLEIVGEDQKYYSEEEEEDKWTKKKSLRESLKKRRSDAAEAKRSELADDSDSDTSSGDGNAAETPRLKKTMSGSDTNVAKTPAANAGTTKSATSSLKKRRILESSDEDE